MSISASRYFVIFILLPLLTGCGSNQYDVTGQIKYNGEVLDRPGGKIAFVGPNGEVVEAAIAPDGSYRAVKVAAGLNHITVHYPNPNIQKTKLPAKSGATEKPPPESPFLTPAKYALADSSELSVMVGRGTIFNANLEGPAIP